MCVCVYRPESEVKSGTGSCDTVSPGSCLFWVALRFQLPGATTWRSSVAESHAVRHGAPGVCREAVAGDVRAPLSAQRGRWRWTVIAASSLPAARLGATAAWERSLGISTEPEKMNGGVRRVCVKVMHLSLSCYFFLPHEILPLPFPLFIFSEGKSLPRGRRGRGSPFGGRGVCVYVRELRG